MLAVSTFPNKINRFTCQAQIQLTIQISTTDKSDIKTVQHERNLLAPPQGSNKALCCLCPSISRYDRYDEYRHHTFLELTEHYCQLLHCGQCLFAGLTYFRCFLPFLVETRFRGKCYHAQVLISLRTAWQICIHTVTSITPFVGARAAPPWGQWGQTAPTGKRQWGQNYVFAPTKFGPA